MRNKLSRSTLSIFLWNNRLKKYATQRWWEKRADAYAKILEAVFAKLDYCDTILQIDAFRERPELSEDERSEWNRKLGGANREISRAIYMGSFLSSEWNRKLGEANREISRAIYMGSFLICDEALECLAVLKKGADESSIHPNDWFSRVEANWKHAKACLDQLTRIAKDDLKTGLPAPVTSFVRRNAFFTQIPRRHR